MRDLLSLQSNDVNSNSVYSGGVRDLLPGGLTKPTPKPGKLSTFNQMFFGGDNQKAFMDTVKSYGSLAKDPMSIVAGAVDLGEGFASAIPGTIGGTQDLFQRVLSGDVDYQDYIDAFSQGFQREAGKFHPLVPLNPKANLVGETFMAPYTAWKTVLGSLADSSVVKTIDKTIDTPASKNKLSSLLKLSGELGGLFLQHGILSKSGGPWIKAKTLDKIKSGKLSVSDQNSLLGDVAKDFNDEFGVKLDDPRLRTPEGRQEVIKETKSDYEAQGLPKPRSAQELNQAVMDLVGNKGINLTETDPFTRLKVADAQQAYLDKTNKSRTIEDFLATQRKSSANAIAGAKPIGKLIEEFTSTKVKEAPMSKLLSLYKQAKEEPKPSTVVSGERSMAEGNKAAKVAVARQRGLARQFEATRKRAAAKENPNFSETEAIKPIESIDINKEFGSPDMLSPEKRAAVTDKFLDEEFPKTQVGIIDKKDIESLSRIISNINNIGSPLQSILTVFGPERGSSIYGEITKILDKEFKYPDSSMSKDILINADKYLSEKSHKPRPRYLKKKYIKGPKEVEFSDGNYVGDIYKDMGVDIPTNVFRGSIKGKPLPEKGVIYVTPSKQIADVYPIEGVNRTTTEYEINLNNPAYLRRHESAIITDKALEQLKDMGYDGVVVPDRGGPTEIAVFNKDQLKLVNPVREFPESSLSKADGIESITVDGVNEYDLFGRRKFETFSKANNALMTETKLRKRRAELISDGSNIDIIKVGDKFRFAESLDIKARETKVVDNYLESKGLKEIMTPEDAKNNLEVLGEKVREWHQGDESIDIESVKDDIAHIGISFIKGENLDMDSMLVQAGTRMIELINKKQAEDLAPVSGKYGPNVTSGRSISDPNLEVIYNAKGLPFETPIEAVTRNLDLPTKGIVEKSPDGEGWIIEMRDPKPQRRGAKAVVKDLKTVVGNEHGSVDLTLLSDIGKLWAKGSKVIDDIGELLPMFHMAKNTDVIKAGFNPGKSKEIGIHFGTEDQVANMLTINKKTKPENYKYGRAVGIPTILNIKNPLRLEDKGNFNPSTVIHQLRQKGIIDEITFEQLNNKFNTGLDEIEQSTIIRELLTKKGYDGIVYKNKYERNAPEKDVTQKLNSTYAVVRDAYKAGKKLDLFTGDVFNVKQGHKNISDYPVRKRTTLNNMVKAEKAFDAVRTESNRYKEQDSYIPFRGDQVKSVYDRSLWKDNKLPSKRILNDLKTVFKLGERGSISFAELSPEKQAAIKRLAEDARRAGKSIREFAKTQGFNESSIKAFEKLAEELYKNPILAAPTTGTENYKTGDIVNKGKLDREKDGYTIKRPRMYKGELDELMQIKDPKRSFIGKFFNEYVTSPQMLKEIDSPIYKQIERLIWDTEAVISDMVSEHAKGLVKIVKPLKRGASERLATNLFWRQKDIRYRMERDGITESDIPNLTGVEEAFIKHIDPILKDMGERINRARTENGLDPIKLIDKDYFSVVYSESFADKMGLKPNLLTDPVKLVDARFKTFKESVFNYKKTRSKEGLKRTLKLNAVEIFDGYMRNAIRHEQLTPIISKLNEMLEPMKTGEFRVDEKGNKHEIIWMMDKKKPNLAQWTRRWSNTIAGRDIKASFRFADSPANKYVEKIANKLSSNVVIALMSGSARSAEIQLGALRNTAAKIGIDYAAIGVNEAFKLAVTGKLSDVKNRSSVLKTRLADVSMEEFFSGVKKGKRALAAKIGLIPLKYADYITAVATWLGSEKFALSRLAKAEAKGNFGGLKELGIEYSKEISHQEIAKRFANDVVVETQGSALASDLAPIQRSAIGKMIHLFQTFTISDWNFLYKDILGVNRKMSAGLKAKRAINFLVATTLLSAFFEDVVGINSPFPTPIRQAIKSAKEGKDAAEITLDVIKEFAEPIPAIGGPLRYGFNPGGAVLQTAWDIFQALSDNSRRGSVLSKSVDKGITRRMALVGEALAKLGGIPATGQAVKMARAAKRGESPYGIIQGSYSGPKKKTSLNF